MTREAPHSEILAVLATLCERLPTTRWYGFGSFFNGRASFSDIDILAVSRDERESLDVRKALSELSSAWPIHLIVMTKDEAVETDFVARQGCRLLTGD
ncbi:MAG: nucleotidyltransferase domain-containing protein [Phenylobacterium sp.]|uniref:nucleotidyltransferase domain-containing protein n=1 Tax=Phenylobacterium sp. TaxID=1871053 RepID=UPI0027ED2B63|nr:nucleotidyltransferase domain-containing protein [Phenylobacterium sp.]